jgi:tRNA(Ile)-lysidine synthase
MIAVEAFAGRRPDSDQVQRVLELLEAEPGAWAPLSGTHLAHRDRTVIVFRKWDQPPEFRYVVHQNHRYEFEGFWFSSSLVEGQPQLGNGDAEYVDADLIPTGDLVLRSWKEGDSFVPLGMQTRKKISDYFIDARIPVYEKRRYPLLETRDGEVIWLCGQRIDERFKVTQGTTRVLKLEFQRTNGSQHHD